MLSLIYLYKMQSSSKRRVLDSTQFGRSLINIRTNKGTEECSFGHSADDWYAV